MWCSGGEKGGGSGKNSGVGDDTESIVYKSVGAGGGVVYWSVGGELCRSGWYFGVGWSFRGAGGRGSGTDGGVCCEVDFVVCEWESIFFVLL